ncbi:MAG TPA: alpha/beta hydrolase [Gemmatimonadales bacterium]|nr:alpha/beta hydrolase [Gemmatimonadales bacterium]
MTKEIAASPYLHRDGTFAGAGGLALYYQAWMPPDGQPKKAVLINLHGLGDHSGLYPTLADHFPPHGIALYAYDMRGNGRSPGQRAYLRGWHEYRGDLHAFLEQVRRWEGDLPIFIVGNSLGGLVVLDYALHYPAGLRGVIAVAPPLGEVGVPPFLMTLGRIMSRIWPRFSLEVGMDLSGLARDPAVAETVLSDPLFHRRGTARLSTEVTAAIQRVHERAETLSVPLLILHGSADRMVPPDGSRRFFSRVEGPDRELREYPDGYHGLFADAGHEEVLKDAERWIEAHMPAKRP